MIRSGLGSAPAPAMATMQLMITETQATTLIHPSPQFNALGRLRTRTTALAMPVYIILQSLKSDNVARANWPSSAVAPTAVMAKKSVPMPKSSLPKAPILIGEKRM